MARIAYLTSIDFGPGTLATLADVARGVGYEATLLVADKGVLAAGIVDKASAFLPAGTPIFSRYSAQPDRERGQGSAEDVSR